MSRWRAGSPLTRSARRRASRLFAASTSSSPMIRPSSLACVTTFWTCGLALVLVGGQHGPGNPGLFHQQQFPDQVCGVPDAGAHALAEKRRHLMRAVAEKEYPIAVPLRRHQGMKPIDRRSPELDGVDIDETRQHLAHPRLVLKFLRLLVRQDLQFPSAQVARDRDRGGGPRRPAILRVHLAAAPWAAVATHPRRSTTRRRRGLHS